MEKSIKYSVIYKKTTTKKTCGPLTLILTTLTAKITNLQMVTYMKTAFYDISMT